MKQNQFNYDLLKNAVISFEKSLQKCEKLKKTDELREYMRDSTIQRFEYTFELAWKALKRFLEIYNLENVDALIGADLFRIGFESGLIQNPVEWMNFKKNRNLTSHTYNEHNAEQVYDNAKLFLHEVHFLLKRLQEKAQ